jgi:SHS2 domain-containing protein
MGKRRVPGNRLRSNRWVGRVQKNRRGWAGENNAILNSLFYPVGNLTMSSSFRFLEDVALADIAFEAEGDSIEDLFRAATRALLETMADPQTVGASWQRRIVKMDAALDDLLVEWLSEIVYWKDAAGVVFHEAPLNLAHEHGQWRVEAALIGAPVNPTLQTLRNDVKGITRHLYRVGQDGPKWKATVVVDV